MSISQRSKNAGQHTLTHMFSTYIRQHTLTHMFGTNIRQHTLTHMIGTYVYCIFAKFKHYSKLTYSWFLHKVEKGTKCHKIVT